MRRALWYVVYQLDAVLLISVGLAHIFERPYRVDDEISKRFRSTPVVEDFNVQAVNDLMYRDWSVPSTFEHATSPRVVPRTFLDPLVLYGIIEPVRRLLSLTPNGARLATRLVIGVLDVDSLLLILVALHKRNEPVVGIMFTLLTALQFEIPFYSGRFHPNLFGFVLTNVAMTARLSLSRPRTILMSHVVLALATGASRS